MFRGKGNLCNAFSGLLFSMFLAVGFISRVNAQDFSADMTSRFGNEAMNAKVFASGDKMRMEMPGSIMIIRGDKKVTWIMMSSERMYMEQPIDPSRNPRTSERFDGEIERISLGPDTVNGVAAEKFKVTYLEKGKNVSAYQWLNNAQFPIKSEAVDGSWSTEYKNVSVNPQPADLFEIPSGYQKITMPSFDFGL